MKLPQGGGTSGGPKRGLEPASTNQPVVFRRDTGLSTLESRPDRLNGWPPQFPLVLWTGGSDESQPPANWRGRSLPKQPPPATRRRGRRSAGRERFRAP